jgi:hypothetical protein
LPDRQIIPRNQALTTNQAIQSSKFITKVITERLRPLLSPRFGIACLS